MSSEYTKLLIGAVVIGAIFMVLWRKGYLLRLSNYVGETREELKKCTWPTVEELKGSTVVVAISVFLLGVFTVAIDLVIAKIVQTMM